MWVGEPSRGADVAAVSPVPVQMWEGEPSPGADVAPRPRARSGPPLTAQLAVARSRNRRKPIVPNVRGGSRCSHSCARAKSRQRRRTCTSESLTCAASDVRASIRSSSCLQHSCKGNPLHSTQCGCAQQRCVALLRIRWIRSISCSSGVPTAAPPTDERRCAAVPAAPMCGSPGHSFPTARRMRLCDSQPESPVPCYTVPCRTTHRIAGVQAHGDRVVCVYSLAH